MFSIAQPTALPMTIQWNAPWLHIYRTLGQAAYAQVRDGSPVHAAFNALLVQTPSLTKACPVRFVPQTQALGAASYESFIFETQTVPTRDNLHDFFNALVWLHFPHLKSKLNSLQALAIAEQGKATERGRLRDALTLFDENAALFFAPTAQWNALKNKAWQNLFVSNRALWDNSQVVIFGHALLEKLVNPRKAMTAHVFCPTAPINKSLDVDTQLAALLSAEHLGTKPFAPLPVLGIPGWCSENEDAGFYEDTSVFRTQKF
jgi:Protein of unknown function (DUF3025)